MKNKSCSLTFKIIVFAITAFIMAFAFIHSSMPAIQSDLESGGVLNILQVIFNSLGINIGLDDHIIRKAAHFIEFFALGVSLSFCAYSFYRKKPYTYAPHIACAGILTAVVDETIQLYVEGRAGLIDDVWLDFSGVVTGATLMLIIFRLYRLIRKL